MMYLNANNQYLNANNHIAYVFSIIAFMLSTLLIHNVYKEHQIATIGKSK